MYASYLYLGYYNHEPKYVLIIISKYRYGAVSMLLGLG